jgi:hypothetical protein
MHRICASLAFGSMLAAQQEPKIPRPMVVEPLGKAEAPAESTPGPFSAARAPEPRTLSATSSSADATVGARTLPGLPVELDRVLFDVPHEGQVWALAPTWKAGFTKKSATFVPFFGSDAQDNRPAEFQVVGAAVGGVVLAAEGLGVEHQADSVTIPRRGFVEQYLVGTSGIEQQFVFDRLPARGELSVDIAVGGGYQVQVDGGGLRFVCDLGSFGYGAPLAFDAVGRTVPMAAQWRHGVLRLVVPGEFVAQAQLPLVIDPLIGNVATLATTTLRYGATDLAFDGSLAMHVATYERVFSQTDSDVLALRLDANLQPIGSAFSVDITTTSWRSCRVANLNAYDKFLVVAESEASASLTAIAGRVYHAGTNTLGSQFDIERGTKACIRPDVGGDPSLATPTYWTVVFERRFTATDGDIMMRQVTESGALRGSGMTAIDASTQRHERPVISRSNGMGTASQQAWLIAYLQDSTGGQYRIEGRIVSWDGQIQASLTYGAWEYSGARREVVVSSPTSTALGRLFGIVFASEDQVTGRMRLRATASTPAGTSASLSLVLTDGSVDCAEPSVETDGARFVFTYARRIGVGGREVVATTYDLPYNAQGGAQHFQLRDVAQFGSSTADTVGLALCSRYTGGATGQDTEYALLWGQHSGVGDALVATRYLGHATQGGLNIRATGCGLPGIQVTTSTYHGVLGSSNTATLPNPGGLVGWVIGLPTSLPIAGCPGCTQGSSAIVTVLGAQTQLDVPYVPAYVGMTLALQAFAFGPGTCLGSLAFSDTADLTIR